MKPLPESSGFSVWTVSLHRGSRTRTLLNIRLAREIGRPFRTLRLLAAFLPYVAGDRLAWPRGKSRLLHHESS